MDKQHVESVVIADLRRANSYFEETVEPMLLERRDIYLASKEYYKKKFPQLSEKTDYRSFDFYAYVQWAKAPVLESFFGTSKVVHVVGCGPEDEESAEEPLEGSCHRYCLGYGGLSADPDGHRRDPW